MRQAILIYNPFAGQINVATTIERVADLWRARGWRVALKPTQHAGHAKILAQEAACAGVDLVLAAGGDGTLGEVAHGLAESETILAPLPVGTANSFARELELPRPTLFNRNRLLQTAELLLEGRVQRVDLGYMAAESQYWLLWAGVGADGFLVDQIEPRSRWSKRLGKFGYLLKALLVGRRLPKLKTAVSVDGQTVHGEHLLVLLSNCRRYAGGELLLNPNARLDDGELDVWFFQGSGLWQGLWYVWQLWWGKTNVKGLEKRNGRSVTVTSTPNALYQIDGEKGGQTPFTTILKPHALRLLVPQTTSTDLFKHLGQPLD